MVITRTRPSRGCGTPPSRPARVGRAPRQWTMRGLVLGQLRQVHQHRVRRRTPRPASATPRADRQAAGRPGRTVPRTMPRASASAMETSRRSTRRPSSCPDRIIGRIEREARGGERNAAVRGPTRASISARRQRRSASLGRHRHSSESSLGRDPVVSTVMRRPRRGPRRNHLVRAGDLLFQGLRQFGLWRASAQRRFPRAAARSSGARS